MKEILYIILLPAFAGLAVALIPERLKTLKSIITFITAVIILYFSYQIFNLKDGKYVFSKIESLSKFFIFNIDPLSRLVLLFIGLFGFLFSFYSIKFIENRFEFKGYYTKFLWTLACSSGAVLSDNLITFIIFWGFLGLILYRFLRGEDERSCNAAKKSFIVIGTSDCILILGVAFLYLKAKSYNISEMSIPLEGWIAISGFVSLLIASLAKAGAFPVHIWIPDYTESGPAVISALLPASLDKLLGIYFLVRICQDIFVLKPWANFLLLLIGSITIIAAVMLALIQHKYKRLLGYHAVSQVGYMVTGIGTGLPIGIVGGLFHMLNNALYKAGLFLVAGAVEKNTNEEELENLGGLASVMPLTFFSALICALSISGVPPLNGFVSKWIIYQALIEYGKQSDLFSNLWFIWLALAVIGSALTLASFIKFITGIFLGRKEEKFSFIKEVNFSMWVPMIIIALLCIIFGILGTSFVVPELLKPVSNEFGYIGLWQSELVGILIITGIVLGFIIYLLGNLKNLKFKRQFIGGEIINEEFKFQSVEFYKTLNEFKILDFLYKKAKEGWFDVYELSKRIVLFISKELQFLHTGVLPLYLLWIILGILIIFLILVR